MKHGSAKMNEWMNEFIFFHFKLQKLLSQVTNILDAQAPPDIKNFCVSVRLCVFPSNPCSDVESHPIWTSKFVYKFLQTCVTQS